MIENQENLNTEIQNPDNSDKSQGKRIEELKQVYQLAIETRDFEISNLIHRNNFYMLFQGVLLAAVFSNEQSKPFVEFTICLAGIMVSWCQIKVSAGAKYWQEYWEIKVSKIEFKLKNKLQEYYDIKDGDWIDLFLLDIHKVENDFGEQIQHNHNQENDNSDDDILKSINNKKYGIFSGIYKHFINSKPSVSIYPLKTAIILLVTWFFLFLQTILLPNNIYQKILNIPIIDIVGLYFEKHGLEKTEFCKNSNE